LLAAEANILANRSEIALILLKDVVGDEARMLRIKIHLRLRNFDEALGELDQLEEKANAIVSPHWFNGDWALEARTNSAAAKIRERVFPDTLTERYTAEEFLPEDSPSLLSAKELLIGVQSMRQEVENVLLK
jgi:hypothetical protein